MNARSVFIKKLLLSFNTLTFASTQILLFTLFPLLSEKLHIPLSTLVMIFSLGTFLFLWGAPYWSAKSDKEGRDKIMAYGLGGLALSFSIIVTLIHFQEILNPLWAIIFLIISRIIYGLMASAIVPVAQLTRSEMSSKDQQTKSMFAHSLTLSLGRTLGPVLLLLSNGHIKTLLLSISIWSVVLLILNIIFRTQANAKFDAHATQVKWSDIGTQIVWPLLITVLFTSYTGVLHSSLGNTLQFRFSMASLEASTLMAKVLMIGSIVMAITQTIGRIFVKNHLRLTLSLGLISLSTGSIILGFMNASIELWSSIILISLGIALIHPSNLALVHQTSDKTTIGKKVGLLSSGNTIGYAIGGTLASFFLGPNINTLSYLIIISLIFVSVMSFRRVRLC